jgi:hypothetical protein
MAKYRRSFAETIHRMAKYLRWLAEKILLMAVIPELA